MRHFTSPPSVPSSCGGSLPTIIQLEKEKSTFKRSGGSRTLCKKTQIPLEAALKAAGIEAKPTDTVLDLARAHQISPMALYAHIEPLSGAATRGASAPQSSPKVYQALDVEAEFAGTGIGNQTLEGIARSTGHSLAQIKARLAAAGLEVAEDEPLKKAAGRLEITPLALLKVLLVDGHSPR
ncbi:hypothetical protein KKF91_04200 [Myxococcota bacterium]|nr:hypothetical protein [Myxococcota bacterium]MBU1429747.1 hypothetical protein [Myxococcota bacterium]